MSQEGGKVRLGVVGSEPRVSTPAERQGADMNRLEVGDIKGRVDVKGSGELRKD